MKKDIPEDKPASKTNLPILTWLAKTFWSTKTRRILSLILILIVAFLVYSITKKPTLTLETTQARQGNLVESVSASGKIGNSQMTDLSFKVPGRLAQVNVKEGVKVVKSQTLASLDTSDISVTLQQAQNTLRDKTAYVDYIHDTVKDHSGDETYLQKSTRTTAEVAHDNAYDSVRAAKVAIQNAVIISPITGVVARINFPTAGVYLNPGTTVLTVVDPSSYYFQADVNETDITKVILGQRVEISLDAYPNDSFKGIVDNIGLTSVITSSGGTAYTVKISLGKTDMDKFKPGMNGDATFILGTKENVLLVPATAIVETGNKSYLWVVTAKGTADQIEVKTGGSSVDETEITSGIADGEKIIARPPTKIAKGDKIVSTVK